MDKFYDNIELKLMKRKKYQHNDIEQKSFIRWAFQVYTIIIRIEEKNQNRT